MRRRSENKDVGTPTALTVIKAIASAGGKTKDHEDYLTKLQMIALCNKWLELQDDRLTPHLDT